MKDTLIIFDFSALSKTDIQRVGKNSARKELEQGFNNPLQRFILAKRASEYLESYMSELKPAALNEAEKHGKGTTAFNSKIDIRSTGARYDYEQDPVYVEIAEKLKIRKELLDLALKSKDQIFDSEGVEVPRVPMKSAGATTLAITY